MSLLFPSLQFSDPWPFPLLPPQVGDDFRESLDRYLQPYLRKGVPSLFVDLHPLYK